MITRNVSELVRGGGSISFPCDLKFQKLNTNKIRPPIVRFIFVHRDSERQLHFDSKFEHEEMVLVA